MDRARKRMHHWIGGLRPWLNPPYDQLTTDLQNIAPHGKPLCVVPGEDPGSDMRASGPGAPSASGMTDLPLRPLRAEEVILLPPFMGEVSRRDDGGKRHP